jgi:hypothetical protein
MCITSLCDASGRSDVFFDNPRSVKMSHTDNIYTGTAKTYGYIGCHHATQPPHNAACTDRRSSNRRAHSPARPSFLFYSIVY